MKLSDDLRDLHVGVWLPMGLLALVMLAAAEFDNANLVALAVTLHGRDHLGRTHVGSADGHRGSGADQQHLIEFDAGASVCVELLDAHHGTFLNAVLFTARGNHGIHFWDSESGLNGAAKEPGIVRVDRVKVKPPPPDASGFRLQPPGGAACASP